MCDTKIFRANFYDLFHLQVPKNSKNPNCKNFRDSVVNQKN